jgi:hypothetical protein
MEVNITLLLHFVTVNKIHKIIYLILPLISHLVCVVI